ncbi:hypothetical protein BC826DRAFT_1177640 [Russula brevipes]|nr:hypothetical protein BC826DRAFT_1177640 [Russula brevipes]
MEDYRAGLPAQERTSCGDYGRWTAVRVKYGGRDLSIGIVGRVDGRYEGKVFLVIPASAHLPPPVPRPPGAGKARKGPNKAGGLLCNGTQGGRGRGDHRTSLDHDANSGADTEKKRGTYAEHPGQRWSLIQRFSMGSEVSNITNHGYSVAITSGLAKRSHAEFRTQADDSPNLPSRGACNLAWVLRSSELAFCELITVMPD